MLGLPRCFTFGGLRVDTAVARELLRAVQPMAIEAAVEVERRYMETQGEKQRIVELELQQARYEASLAERRYAACDPDNRLIAAQLEKSWEAALCRVETCQARLEAVTRSDPAVVPPDFTGLADDLNAAWNGVTMRTRQRLLRALVTDIIADVDEATREIGLTIHWRGGQHSQLRVRKPNSGERPPRPNLRPSLAVRLGWPRSRRSARDRADAFCPARDCTRWRGARFLARRRRSRHWTASAPPRCNSRVMTRAASDNSVLSLGSCIKAAVTVLSSRTVAPLSGRSCLALTNKAWLIASQVSARSAAIVWCSTDFFGDHRSGRRAKARNEAESSR
jgi:hypothetical protein